MKEIPVHNNTERAESIGGILLRPGESRMIDEQLVPDQWKPKPQAEATEAEADPLDVILDGNVAEVIDSLADLDVAQLDALADREHAGKNRKGVTEAIAARQIELAAADNG